MVVEFLNGKLVKGFELLKMEVVDGVIKINIETNAEVEIFEHYTYLEDVEVKMDICVGQNAKLDHYILQEYSDKKHNLSANINVKRDGFYNLVSIQKGNSSSKNDISVRLIEDNAKSDINIAYILGGESKIVNDILVEHLVPYTFSTQLVKGVVDGMAKSDFHGKIHIAKHAVKTEGNQLHKALLLSDTGEIKCLPELEIFADDVKCSHGAATGVLDEKQLFYMCSRGIGRQEARQMLIDAYLDDVINKIGNNEVYSFIKDRIK